ncbi:hypothetical protein C0J52_13948 [Blattella germanica]|nr:hypothetical protein C0J52_13948 [Blattella germanica]
MVRNLRLGLFFIIHLYGIAAKEVTNNHVTPICSRTGVYFDSRGKLQLYPIQWNIVSYIDLGPKTESWYLRTDCNAFIPYLISKVRYLDNFKEDIHEFTLENPDNCKFLYCFLPNTNYIKYYPFLVHAEESRVKTVYMYTSSKRVYIFSDPLRQKFGKLTFSELQSCSKPE